MALRLGDYVVRGEFDNRRGYETKGWLELRGSGEILSVELMGDMSEDLKGKRIRFECTKNGYKSIEELSASQGQFADRFVGATAMMTADHRVKLFDCPIGEFYMRCKMGEPVPTFWRRCLYLEWYGNCGRVLIELPDATVWIVEGEGEDERMSRLPDIDEGPEEEDREEAEASDSLEIVEIEQVDEDTMRVARHQVSDSKDEAAFGDSDDPYALFSDDFKKMMGRSAEQSSDSKIEEEFLKMDKILDGSSKGDRLGDLIGTAPDWKRLNDEEVEGVLKTAVGKLGLFNVTYHVCEHMSPREACRYLFEELADCEIHRELEGGSLFCHFSTMETCPKCQEDFEREHENFSKRKVDSDED